EPLRREQTTEKGSRSAPGGSRDSKKGCKVLRATPRVRYEWVHEHRKEFRISTMCRVLGVRTQGYYAWRNRDDTDASDILLVAEIRDVMKESRHTYGIIRVT